MDKAWISNQFTKSLNSYNSEAIAQKQIVEKTSKLLLEHLGNQFSRIFEFGSGTGLFTSKIIQNIQFDHLYLNDLNESFYIGLEPVLESLDKHNWSFLKGDVETIDFPKKQDLIVSTSTEQWVNNKPEFYKKVSQSLSKTGCFVFSSFGPENLKEIKSATGFGLEYFSIDDVKYQLQNYFEIVHAEEEQIVLYFESPKDILRHLKKTGVNGLQRKHWTKKMVNEVLAEIEKSTYSSDNKYKLTYHPTYFLLKTK
jgi:malonyl-ACP O-methyltransferase BioC